MNQCTVFKIVVVLILLGSYPGVSYGQPGPDDPGHYLYVCNQGAATVSVIDLETHEIAARIDLQELGFSPNAKPHHAVVEPDGSHWYVSLIGENLILKFNHRNELVGRTEMEVPGLLAIHPTKDELYVARSMMAMNPPQSFAIIRRSDMEHTEEVETFFPRPHGITIHPNGKWVFVASLAENQMVSIDLESLDSELTMFPGDTHVFVDFGLSPDGNTLVITGQISGQLLVLDTSNPASPELIETIQINPQPWRPIFSPDGKRLYVPNKESNTVTVIDMTQHVVEAVIEGKGLAQPHGSAISPDGKWLYISNNNLRAMPDMDQHNHDAGPPGYLVVIDTETLSIDKVIEVETYSTGIGTRARQK
ncbi:MAG: YncE family protein [Balneolaceae bacterium]